MVSPAGTVGAFGFCAVPQTPFGNAASGRGMSDTSVRSNARPSGRSIAMASVLASVAEYIGATPSPGAGTGTLAATPAGPVNCSADAGAVATNVSTNSGLTRS